MLSERARRFAHVPRRPLRIRSTPRTAPAQLHLSSCCSFCGASRRQQIHACRRWSPALLFDYEQVGMPRGSGSLQVFVVPSVVMTIVAVADPSYVMTSRRSFVVGVPPASVIVAFICRTTLPAVGYVGFPLTTGMTSA